jgi:hypothetical protein
VSENIYIEALKTIKENAREWTPDQIISYIGIVLSHPEARGEHPLGID